MWVAWLTRDLWENAERGGACVVMVAPHDGVGGSARVVRRLRRHHSQHRPYVPSELRVNHPLTQLDDIEISIN